MYQLLKLFYDICLLKKGPQDIPVSNWLFQVILIVSIFVDFLVLILSTDLFSAILQTLVEITLTLGLTWVILYTAKKRFRFQQTVCAFMATDILISLLALPAIAMLVNDGSGSIFFVIILLMVWHWIVSGHIFSHALGQPFSFGLGVAFLYIFISMQVMGVLFPEVILAE
ncbi:MAG: hypothetical protein L3J59_07860 [Methylococcaceae bacterium]|nr:hypothetical protein [Methylococcaceae bacterium]